MNNSLNKVLCGVDNDTGINFLNCMKEYGV
jgi:hypothetical protein